MPRNDRLRDALTSVGITRHELAAQLGVDPKTVERWVTQGRIPYRRHRSAVALLLRETEVYLWPEALSDHERARVAESEIIRVYPRRAVIPTDTWTRLFEGATASIDVLVYAALFLPEQQPQLLTNLCRKATDAGTRIRFLLGDPACEQVARRGAEEGIGDAIAYKIRNVLRFFEPHAEHRCMDLRLHRTTLYTSIYRFDRQMLVNHHVLGRPAAHAPVMHLRQLDSGDLFATHLETFEWVWSDAVPAWRAQEVA